MRKSLFAIGLLAISCSAQAQILCHIDANANMYVSEGTLVYSGGGVQTRDNGLLDIHGNVMVAGAAGDAFKTITTTGTDKTDGGNIILRLNTPATYATSTYGQLYIDGLVQANMTGIVSKEYRTDNNGSGNYFQQVALPFFGKTFSSLSTELGKNFGTTRSVTNANFVNNDLILKWDNTNSVSNHFTNLSSTTSDGSGYYMLGSKNNNLNVNAPSTGSVYTLNGRPYAQFGATTTLQNGGNVAFGPNGNNKNVYLEYYKTYIQDSFDISNGAWTGTYGKNFYQFGNPFLTNLDLSKIGFVEGGTVTDGNNVANIWGIEYSPGTVTTQNTGGSSMTYTTGAQVQTFNLNGTPIGDMGLIIKPMQSFKIKLRDNSSQTLDFNTLRRFNNTVRVNGVDYNVAAAKSSTKATYKGSVKQLGVIGLDADHNEIARTYYVVSDGFTTGHQTSAATTVQAASSKSNLIGTFEEALNGGYDNNYTGQYWLYINEANENSFQGKNVMLVNYAPTKVKYYKFEIRENAELIPAGINQLSSGIGFYYKAENGTVEEARQGAIIPVTHDEYNLYYGAPTRVTLAGKDGKKEARPSRTAVVYNPTITNYIVRFDPDWKKADIEVYDMSGKLVISKKAVDASRDFVIELDSSIKNSYVVKIVSDKGETVNTKILK